MGLLDASGIVEDHETVIAAVSQNWKTLQHASDELKGNEEIVRTAVARCWKAIFHGSRDFRSHHEIIMLAVLQNGTALQYSSKEHLGEYCICHSYTSPSPAGHKECRRRGRVRERVITMRLPRARILCDPPSPSIHPQRLDHRPLNGSF